MKCFFCLLVFLPCLLVAEVFPPPAGTLYLTLHPGQTLNYDTSYQGIDAIWSNRPDYVTVEYSKKDNTLSIIAGDTPGFASIAYTAWGGATPNVLGIVILNNGRIPGLPNHLSIGGRSYMQSYTTDFQWWPEGGQTDGQVVTNTRWTDLMDIYMQGGPYDWVTQGSAWDEKWYPGKYLATFIDGCKQQGRIPCVVFYCIPASGVPDSALGDLQNVCDQNTSLPYYMLYYYNITLRTLRDVVYEGTKDGWPIVLVIEPDFLGYMMQTIQADPNADPITYPIPGTDPSQTFSGVAAVSDAYRFFGTPPYPSLPSPLSTNQGARGHITSDPLLTTENFPNTLKGLATSIPYILKKTFTTRSGTTGAALGPNVKIGWKMNLWASPPQGFSAGGINRPGGIPFGVAKGICRWTDVCYPPSPGADFSTVVGWLRSEASGIAQQYYRYGITENTNFIALDRYGKDGGSYGKLKPNYVYSGAEDPTESDVVYFWNSDHWMNYLTFVQTVQSTISLAASRQYPVFLWQIPCGHLNNSAAVKYRGGSYSELMNKYNTTPGLSNAPIQGDYEDSAQTFLFGDTFNPGAWPRQNRNNTQRALYFSQDLYQQFSPPSGGVMTWPSHLADFANAGVFAILSAPGVGYDASTYPVPLGGIGPYDDLWWLDHVQTYYRNPIPLTVPQP